MPHRYTELKEGSGAEQSENYEVELRESVFLQEEKHPIVARFPGIAHPPFE
jgi:hypothetical protein